MTILIKVHVETDAVVESITAKGEDSLDIRVRESAEHNLANKRVLEIVRTMYSHSAVKIVKGHHSPHKIISVHKNII